MAPRNLCGSLLRAWCATALPQRQEGKGCAWSWGPAVPGDRLSSSLLAEMEPVQVALHWSGSCLCQHWSGPGDGLGYGWEQPPGACTELCTSSARAGSQEILSLFPLQRTALSQGRAGARSALCLYRVFCPIYLPQMTSPLPTPCNTPRKIINGSRLCKQSLSPKLFEM